MPCERRRVVRFYDTKLTFYSDGKMVVRKYDSHIRRFEDGYEDLNDNKVSDFCTSQTKKKSRSIDDEVRFDSIARSRKMVIDYSWENKHLWKSFLTLTFADNVTDISIANKAFNSWLTLMRKNYNDFAYLAVPEYQKRGAVHYHLLTNLVVGSDLLPLQDNKKNMYNVKFWNKGFTSAFDLKLADDKFNVSLYVCKYLYKDIDNRLYGRKKVMHSQNLKLPKVVKYTQDDLFFEGMLTGILSNNDITEFTFIPKEKFQIGFKESTVMLSSGEFDALKYFLGI